MENNKEEETKPKVSPASKEDDLTQIKGISLEMAKALRIIGINSFEHLASYTPQRLNNIFRAQEPPISLSNLKLDVILEQALNFAQARPGNQARKQNSGASNGQKKKRQFEKHWKTEEWAELADFFISFGYQITVAGEKQLQTRAIHYEMEEETKLENIASQELLDWMMEQAKPALPPEYEPPNSHPEKRETAQGEEAEKLLELSVLGITEVPGLASGPATTALSKVCVETELVLSPSVMSVAEEQTPFTIGAFLVNLQTNQALLTAVHPAELRPGSLHYQVMLDFPMPEAGRYKLHLAAHLLSPNPITAFSAGPTIRVES